MSGELSFRPVSRGVWRSEAGWEIRAAGAGGPYVVKGPDGRRVGQRRSFGGAVDLALSEQMEVSP